MHHYYYPWTPAIITPRTHCRRRDHVYLLVSAEVQIERVEVWFRCRRLWTWCCKSHRMHSSLSPSLPRGRGGEGSIPVEEENRASQVHRYSSWRLIRLSAMISFTSIGVFGRRSLLISPASFTAVSHLSFIPDRLYDTTQQYLHKLNKKNSL